LTSDDLPQPDGPYSSPTLKVRSGSVSSTRPFQKRRAPGRPSRSRGPGSRSRKKSASAASNERSPLGTTAAACLWDAGGAGGRGGAVGAGGDDGDTGV